MALVNKHQITRTLVKSCIVDVKSMNDDGTRNAALRVFNESLAVIQLLALRDPTTIEKVFIPQHSFLERIMYVNTLTLIDSTLTLCTALTLTANSTHKSCTMSIASSDFSSCCTSWCHVTSTHWCTRTCMTTDTSYKCCTTS